MEPRQSEMILTLEVEGAPGDVIADRAASLLNDLRELGGARVEPLAAGSPPPGAKGFEDVAMGTLAVAVLPIVLPALLQALQSWLNAQSEARKLTLNVSDGKRSVQLEYSANALSPQELEQLVTSLTDKTFGRR